MELLFCTTNAHKFALAEMAGKKHGITIEQLKIEVDEIQSEDPKRILEHKIRAIYEQVHKPLVVTDDSWSVPALNGFPGPYMKSINHWLAPEDWLTLMKNHPDKRVFIERRLAYIDDGQITTFEDIRERVFLDRVSERDGVSILRVTALAGQKMPINELWLDNPEKIESTESAWDEFFKWYESRS